MQRKLKKARLKQQVKKQQKEQELNQIYAQLAPHVQQGMQLLLAGRLGEAKNIFEKVLTAHPKHPDALHFLGIIAIQHGELNQAKQLIAKSINIYPNNAAAYSSMGTACFNLKEAEESVTWFEKSLELQPDNPETLGNYAKALNEIGKKTEAIKTYEQALKINPSNYINWNGYGLRLQERGEIDEAIAAFKRSGEANPEFYYSYSNMLFAMNYSRKFSAEDIYNESVKWAEKYAPESLAEKSHKNNKDKSRKLRIGYVSADFFDHPVAHVIKKHFKFHDKDNFEVFCYSNNSNEDEVTEELKSYVDKWTRIVGVNDTVAAELIKKDWIDILVDLSGHTGNNRLLVFARKPAPVQASWMGYVNTTGMKQMDYYICDNFLYTDEIQKYFVEKLYPLPGAVTSFEPPHVDIEVSELPAIKNGYITFANFNNFSKMTDEAIKLWAEILNKTPNSKLFLKAKSLGDKDTRAKCILQFESNKISKDRLIFEGQSPMLEYYKAHHKVDIALDTFPYNGGTTTINALWMGVPVVTLVGDMMFSRCGYSVLGSAGLKEFVAKSKEEYINKVCKLARDLNKLSEVRKNLRKKINNSLLFDGKKVTRNLEEAYRKMWKDYVAS